MNRLYTLRDALRRPAGAWQKDKFDDLEPAAVDVANAVAGSLPGSRWSPDQLRIAAQAVHYGTGILMGALYGGMAAIDGHITAGGGTGFGAVVWLLADEIALPAARLSPSPLRTPMGEQLVALAAHVLYGATLEAVRSGFRIRSEPAKR